MLRFLEAMEALNPEIVPELAWQMGRPVRYGGELRSLAERVRGLVEMAPEALAPDLPASGDDVVRRVDRVPVGLVLVVAPWNYPFLTAANTIVAALLAGNAVLLKPSAQTPLAGERFAQALDDGGIAPRPVRQPVPRPRDGDAGARRRPSSTMPPSPARWRAAGRSSEAASLAGAASPR